jgi:glycerate-2-kinase
MAQRVSELAIETVAALGGERLVRAAGVAADEVWAVGKAACAMARGSGCARGIVITKQAETVGGFQVLEAGHPHPDERSVTATAILLARAREVAPGTRVLVCISGGTSALLGGPVAGVSLAEMRAVTRALLDGGAAIGEINTVRRHLGAALGGKLAAATRAELSVLALSDVVGDDPAAIGSGPASPDPTTLDDARVIASRFGLGDLLARAPETPKTLPDIPYRILASPLSLRDEAARRATDFTVRTRPSLVSGPVEAVAAELAALTLAPGELWIAAGEPTVEVRGGGLGGRAQHLALLMARALAGRDDVSFVALGSDGSDGPTTAAGAAVDGSTWERARGLDPERALTNFDSHPLLDALGATLVTGPTGTNLTDLLLLGRRA